MSAARRPPLHLEPTLQSLPGPQPHHTPYLASPHCQPGWALQLFSESGAAGQGTQWEVNGPSELLLPANLQPESEALHLGGSNPSQACIELLHPSNQAGRGGPGGWGCWRAGDVETGRFQKG